MQNFDKMKEVNKNTEFNKTDKKLIISDVINSAYGFIIEEKFSFQNKYGEPFQSQWHLQFNKHFYKRYDSAQEAIEQFKKQSISSEFRIVPLMRYL
jgi:hypothetical protein